jgi:hypothetical protein
MQVVDKSGERGWGRTRDHGRDRPTFPLSIKAILKNHPQCGSFFNAGWSVFWNSCGPRPCDRAAISPARSAYNNWRATAALGWGDRDRPLRWAAPKACSFARQASEASRLSEEPTTDGNVEARRPESAGDDIMSSFEELQWRSALFAFSCSASISPCRHIRKK